MVWLAGGGVSLLLVIFVVMGLVDLARNRDTMSTGQTVGWGAFIILVPFVGLIGYLFWRISRSEAMADALSVERDPKHSRQINPGRR